MSEPGKSLLHGTLDVLILKATSDEPRHGYGIARWLENATGDAIQVEEGSLYPALYRLERKGLLESEWGRSELDRRAKLYRLTEKGAKRLRKETAAWERFARAVSGVLLSQEG